VDASQDCLYFTGHSLGLQPKNASGEIEREMKKWATRGARGHMTGQLPWFYIEDYVSEQSAKIVGCQPLEVTSMNTLTVNIHFALVRCL
jgi:kynureninase